MRKIRAIVLFFGLALFCESCSIQTNSVSSGPQPVGFCNLFQKPLKVYTLPAGPDTVEVCGIGGLTYCECMAIDTIFGDSVIPHWRQETK